MGEKMEPTGDWTYIHECNNDKRGFVMTTKNNGDFHFFVQCDLIKTKNKELIVVASSGGSN